MGVGDEVVYVNDLAARRDRRTEPHQPHYTVTAVLPNGLVWVQSHRSGRRHRVNPARFQVLTPAP